jgi:hypothetical protein
MRTESWSAYHERMVDEGVEQAERSHRILSVIRLRKMGQQALPGLEEVGKVIPIRPIKDVIRDLTA